MGLPFWEMPKVLVIGGAVYPIDTDFRVGIRIRQMFWETYYQRRQDLLIAGIRRLLLYGAEIGDGQETAFLCAVLWYLMDGRMSEERILRRLTDTQKTAAVSSDGEAVFSYLWDMPSVYAAFLSEYRVDLLTVGMHLWQFDALFASLPDECALRRTMAIRASSLDSAEDGDARAHLAAQKLAAAVPDADMLYQSCFSQNGGAFCCSFAKQKKNREGGTDAGQQTQTLSAEECGNAAPSDEEKTATIKQRRN